MLAVTRGRTFNMEVPGNQRCYWSCLLVTREPFSIELSTLRGKAEIPGVSIVMNIFHHFPLIMCTCAPTPLSVRAPFTVCKCLINSSVGGMNKSSISHFCHMFTVIPTLPSLTQRAISFTCASSHQGGPLTPPPRTFPLTGQFLLATLNESPVFLFIPSIPH